MPARPASGRTPCAMMRSVYAPTPGIVSHAQFVGYGWTYGAGVGSVYGRLCNQLPSVPRKVLPPDPAAGRWIGEAVGGGRRALHRAAGRVAAPLTLLRNGPVSPRRFLHGAGGFLLLSTVVVDWQKANNCNGSYVTQPRGGPGEKPLGRADAPVIPTTVSIARHPTVARRYGTARRLSRSGGRRVWYTRRGEQHAVGFGPAEFHDGCRIGNPRVAAPVFSAAPVPTSTRRQLAGCNGFDPRPCAVSPVYEQADTGAAPINHKEHPCFASLPCGSSIHRACLSLPGTTKWQSTIDAKVRDQPRKQAATVSTANHTTFNCETSAKRPRELSQADTNDTKEASYEVALVKQSTRRENLAQPLPVERDRSRRMTRRPASTVDGDGKAWALLTQPRKDTT